MFITIMPPMSPNEEPVNEFTVMQEHLDRASWQGSGCTLPFKKDGLASFRNDEERK